MPTFPTPDPIDLRVRIKGGEVILDASARTDTEVDVQPARPTNSADVKAAEETTVSHHDGQVTIEVPDTERKWIGSRGGNVRVQVSLPEGSQVKVATASGDVRARGRLGHTAVTTASGDVSLDHADALNATTASGDLSCRNVVGDAKVVTASGDVSLVVVGGSAEVSTASGDSNLREIHGDVRVNTASGDAVVGAAHGSVSGKTASGDLAIRFVEQGEVSIKGASGDVFVGVAAGTAAWLDVSSLSGDVVSRLDQAEQPAAGEKTVEIRVHTLSGDVVISRA